MKVILLLMLAYCFHSHARDSLIVVKPGTSFGESVSMTDLYQYPQFVTGKLFFRTGEVCDRTTFGIASKETITHLNL